MTRFLSLGEIMVEMAPAPQNPGLFRLGYAGDTFNTAWYAPRLLPSTRTVSYVTVLGEDAMSDDLARFIGAQGMSNDAIRRHPTRTPGLYMIQTREGERSFSYWRGQSAAKRMAEDLKWLDSALKGRDMIHFSAITLAILPPKSREFFCGALARARSKGAIVSFDTNLRPALWESVEAMKAGAVDFLLRGVPAQREPQGSHGVLQRHLHGL